MMLRSLRWRLVVAMTLIIAAVVIVAGAFSSLTVKREFDRYLIEKRHDSARAAARTLLNAAPGALHAALVRVHEQQGFQSVVFNARGAIIDRYPADVASYDIRLTPDGILHLTTRENGRFESLILNAPPVVVGDARVFLMPPREQRTVAFRNTIDRRLIAGTSIAALLAIAVMMTLFRRVFAPVEALTRGARALARGKLDTRVPMRGRDEVAELASAFNGMAEALERNEKARRNMVSDVAHELRTPLTNIRAQLEAVQDGVMTADGEWLASMEEEAALLARLVDDLQQLSLAEAGELRLELAEVEVAELVERAVSGLAFRELACDVPRGLLVRADARRMMQVLRNLLVNAITHAASAIRVSASRVHDRIEIRVADDGPGIADEHAERVFDRFYRVDASRSRATGGAGLGLAIAKELIELHGGTIRYERPAFVVTLPAV
jgi:signal transduction histidine kinase